MSPLARQVCKLHGGYDCDEQCYCFLAPTGPPLNLRGTVVTARSLSLSWDPPLLRHRNGPITGYRVRLNALEVPSLHLFNTTSSSLAVASEIHPYFTYRCKVQAMTSIDFGPYSGFIDIRTLQDG